MNPAEINQDNNYNNILPSVLSLRLTGPPTMSETHLMSDENLTNFTQDEAIARIRQLTAENTQLKTTIQQTNASMRMAVESFTTLQIKAKKDEEQSLQHYHRSRSVVEVLKKQIAEKDRAIEALKKKISEDPVMLQPSDEIKLLENENKKLSVEIDELKQKSAKQELLFVNEIKVLKTQLTTLLTSQETAKRTHLQEKAQIENKYFSLEDQMQKMQNEEQRKLKSLKDQNEKVNMELVNVSRKYEQLMSDYHDLLTSNDHHKSSETSQAAQMKIDFENRIDNLTAQLVTAEEVLTQKQDQIQTLAQKLNDLEALPAQVDIYKADFEAERKSREDLNDRLLELTEKYRQLEVARNANAPQVNARFPANRPPGPFALPLRAGHLPMSFMAPDPVPNPLVSPVHRDRPVVPEPEPEPDLICPICARVCPDIDSLQLHVNECIETH